MIRKIVEESFVPETKCIPFLEAPMSLGDEMGPEMWEKLKADFLERAYGDKETD